MSHTTLPELTRKDLLQRVIGVEEQLARVHDQSPAQAAQWLTFARKTYIWAVWAERQRVTESDREVKRDLSGAVDRLEAEWFATLRRIDDFATDSPQHRRLRSVLADLARCLPTNESMAERQVGLLLDLLLSEVRAVTRPVDAGVRSLVPGRGRIYKQAWQRDEGRVPEKPLQVVASSSRRFRG